MPASVFSKKKKKKLECLTFIDDGLLLPKVSESRKGLDTIMFGEPFVIDFDKVHAKVIRIVINLL